MAPAKFEYLSLIGQHNTNGMSSALWTLGKKSEFVCSFLHRHRQHQRIKWWLKYIRTWVENLSLNVSLRDFSEPRQSAKHWFRQIISYFIMSRSYPTWCRGVLLHVSWVARLLHVHLLLQLDLVSFFQSIDLMWLLIKKASKMLIVLTLISRLSVSPPGCKNAQCSRSLEQISWNLEKRRILVTFRDMVF